MRVADAGGLIPGQWGSEGADATTAVQNGESTLTQVASRLGIPLDDLVNANPQIANPNGLTPGMEVRVPSSTQGGPAAGSAESDAPDPNIATSKRMENSLEASAMRTLLSSPMDSSSGSVSHAHFSASGSGGISQEPPVADPLRGEGYSPQLKKELTQTLNALYQRPEFKALSQDEKSALLQSLAGNPPVTPEKISKMFDLINSAKSLSPANHKLVMEAFKAGHASPAYAASLKKLIEDPEFKSLTNAEKTAVLSQVKNYPDAKTIGNIERMLRKDWFQTQSLGDKQRSLKTIAAFSHNQKGDRKIIDNTLDKLLDPKSHFDLEWKKYEKRDRPYGEADDDTLYLNRGIIRAGNDPITENKTTNHLALNTVAHEINHLVNDDKVGDTFDYFNAEYRAWYVGFKAEHGRPPSNQEAMEQRIRWQFDPESAYGATSAGALKHPSQAQKLFDFLGKMTGLKVDAHNWRDVVYKSDPATWRTKASTPAAPPAGNDDNH